MNVPRKFHRLIVLRAMTGFFSLACMFNAVKFTAVSTVNCINMTISTWVAIISYFALGEKLSYFDIFGLVLAFIGVIIINDPFNWVDDKKQERTDIIIGPKEDTLIGVLSALFSAIFGAVSMVTMRIMRTDVHYAVPPFWFALGGVFFGPILMVMTRNMMYPEVSKKIVDGRDVSKDPDGKVPTTVYDGVSIAYILVASFVSFLGQVFISKAFQLEKAARVSLTVYVWIAVGVFSDLYLFDISFTWLDILGCILIISVSFISALLKAFGVTE